MMSMYCGTCGHHSSMHYFAAPTKNALGFNHGCSTVNTDGRDCMCSGFKKKQYTFSDRVKRYAEQQLARQALFNAKLRRGPRGVGKYWSGKKDVEKNAEDK